MNFKQIFIQSYGSVLFSAMFYLTQHQHSLFNLGYENLFPGTGLCGHCSLPQNAQNHYVTDLVFPFVFLAHYDVLV